MPEPDAAAPASSQRAPLIALRIPRELDERLRAHVDGTGSTISDVARGTIGKRPKRAAVSRCEHRVTSGAFCGKCGGLVP